MGKHRQMRAGMTHSVKSLVAVVLSASLALGGGCNEPVTIYQVPGTCVSTGQKVLVMPFMDTRTFVDNGDPLKEDIGEHVRDIYVAAMRENSAAATAVILTPDMPRQEKSLSNAEVAELGRRHGADIVVAGQVFSFTGTRAASIPPRAGMFVRVVSASDGAILFVGDHYQSAGVPGAPGGRDLQARHVAETLVEGLMRDAAPALQVAGTVASGTALAMMSPLSPDGPFANDEDDIPTPEIPPFLGGFSDAGNETESWDERMAPAAPPVLDYQAPAREAMAEADLPPLPPLPVIVAPETAAAPAPVEEFSAMAAPAPAGDGSEREPLRKTAVALGDMGIPMPPPPPSELLAEHEPEASTPPAETEAAAEVEMAEAAATGDEDLPLTETPDADEPAEELAAAVIDEEFEPGIPEPVDPPESFDTPEMADAVDANDTAEPVVSPEVAEVPEPAIEAAEQASEADDDALLADRNDPEPDVDADAAVPEVAAARSVVEDVDDAAAAPEYRDASYAAGLSGDELAADLFESDGEIWGARIAAPVPQSVMVVEAESAVVETVADATVGYGGSIDSAVPGAGDYQYITETELSGTLPADSVLEEPYEVAMAFPMDMDDGPVRSVSLVVEQPRPIKAAAEPAQGARTLAFPSETGTPSTSSEKAVRVLLLPYHDRDNPNNLIVNTGGGEVVTTFYGAQLAQDPDVRLLWDGSGQVTHDRLVDRTEAIALGKISGADYVVRGQVVEFRRAQSVPSFYSAMISTAVLAAQIFFAEFSGVDVATEVYRVSDGRCVMSRRDRAQQKYVVQAEKTVRKLAAGMAKGVAAAVKEDDPEEMDPLIDFLEPLTVITNPR